MDMKEPAYQLGVVRALMDKFGQEMLPSERGFMTGAGLGLGASIPLAYYLGQSGLPLWAKLLAGGALGPIGVLGGGAAGYGVGRLFED